MSEPESYSLEDAFADVIRTGDEARDEVLFQRWYRGLLDRAILARHHAGLTQADIAEAMGTTQSAIARLENDTAGGTSARRLWNYLVACGLLPLAETRKTDHVYQALQADPAVALMAVALDAHATAEAEPARTDDGQSAPPVAGWARTA